MADQNASINQISLLITRHFYAKIRYAENLPFGQHESQKTTVPKYSIIFNVY